MAGRPKEEYESNADKLRITVVMVFCLLVAAAVLSRAVFVQLIAHSRLEQMAKKQFQSKVLIQPRRGPILDRNGEPLAVNSEADSLAANPGKVSNKRTLARILEKAIDLPASKIFQRLNEKREFVWIKRHISESDINRLKKWRVMDLDGDLVSGLWLVKESQRVYPHGELASHVLGDVNIDTQGLEGVELWQNERLRGKYASVTTYKDALGRPIFIDALAAKHVQDGSSVTLTLDASLQFAVEEQLKASVQKTGSKAGTVIVMNAVTGEVLAMANQPSFNPNQREAVLSAPADHRRNRGLTDGYEPGSTLKAVLLASALSKGMKLSDQIWGERGQFKVQGKRIAEAEAHEQFGWLSLKRIIKLSSNIGAAKLALKVGADSYLSELKTFGFGVKTDTGFPGEISGQVPARKNWKPLTLANIGFGQGILVTPMQMVRAYATFLNGGWLVQPSIVRSSGDDGIKVDPPKRILSQRACDNILESLESVTEDGGTGIKARLPGYSVAGKTGTAQKVEPAGGYSKTKHIASFIGFPLDVEPKLVIFAALDEPHGVYYAADTAAPLFREVLNAVANRFSLPAKEETTVPKLAVTDHINAVQAAPTLVWQGTNVSGGFIWRMPSVRGLTAREALRTLKGHRFKVEIRGEGLVRFQSPPEGKNIAEGETVRLNLMEP